MNLIDLAVLLVFAAFAVFSMYRGFLHSVLKTAADLVSWVIAMILHPLLALIFGGRGIISFLANYTEGAAKLSDTAYLTRLVSDVPQADLRAMVDTSSLPMPFAALTRQNLLRESFARRGLTTVGEYCNETVAQATLNILCFIVAFLIIRLIIGLYINIVDYKRPLPILVRHELPFAAVAGLLRGILACYIVFALTPILLSVFDVQLIVDYVSSSFFGTVFYRTNIALFLVGGT